MAVKCAQRSRKGRALGMVIINLQQTAQDGKATLRLFAPTDVVLAHVVLQLGLGKVLHISFTTVLLSL